MIPGQTLKTLRISRAGPGKECKHGHPDLGDFVEVKKEALVLYWKHQILLLSRGGQEYDARSAGEYAPPFVCLTEGRCSARPKSSAAVHGSVACSTEGNQILARIITGVAAKLSVVDFQVGHRTARLASPTITRQHLNTELFVQCGIEP